MSTTNHNLSPSQEAIDGAVKLYDSIRTAFPRAVANFELKWTSADEEQREQSTPVKYCGLFFLLFLCVLIV